MCTLTWTHGDGQQPIDPQGSSYRLWFNRDELRSRGPEVPPHEAVTAHGVRYVAPADSDAGGTWLSVNEFGVTVALLNGYRTSRGPARDTWTSRGLLVRSLSDLRGPDEVWRRLSPRALAEFRPCVIAVVSPSSPTLIARWDGLDVVTDPTGERQLPVTSSGYEQSVVQRSRRELYTKMVTDRSHDGAPTPELLAAFQRYVEDDGPTPFTPSMARDDASTRSQCFIEVDTANVLFSYAPGAPHDTDYQPPVILTRAQ